MSLREDIRLTSGGDCLVTSRETLGSVDSLEDYVEKIEDAKVKNPDTYGP